MQFEICLIGQSICLLVIIPFDLNVADRLEIFGNCLVALEERKNIGMSDFEVILHAFDGQLAIAHHT